MNRRRFIESVVGGIAGVQLLAGPPSVVAYDAAHRIRTHNGITIDNQFGNVERRILSDALAHFYARFLQPYRPGDYGRDRVFRAREWNNAYSDVTARHVGHYQAGVNDRNIFGQDWLDMWRHFVNAGKAFPPITLKFVHAANGNFVAQAHLDLILINSFPNDTPYTRTGRTAAKDGVESRAEFEIDINDWYLGNGAAGRQYLDPVFWAGVIAHEAWHNLGHGHPAGRGVANYYQHQIVLHEMCVMQDSSIRYGLEASTPVYCRRHPG